jgi:NTP pyrophosphatase (non-canonical NTP hydrolase)
MGSISVKDLEQKIIAFRDARDWHRYHTPKNLAISLAIELGELLEHFQWKTDEEILESVKDPKKKEEVADELADVAIYLITLAHELGIDLGDAIAKKVVKNEKKYPVHLVKGKYVKYTELRRHGNGA